MKCIVYKRSISSLTFTNILNMWQRLNIFFWRVE